MTHRVARALRPLSRPLSPVYGAAVTIRNRLYDRGLASSRGVGAPVISVGNLTAGGTGKTPVTRAIAGLLLERGHRPAILLRGYRARGARAPAPTWIERPPPGALARWGDEALCHARELPGAAVHALADRITSAGHALAGSADVLLLDDGFQHRRLRRDIDIVCLDWMRPLGSGGLLPAGELREPEAALGRADLVMWTRWRAGESDAGQHRRLARWLRGLDAVRWCHEPGRIRIAGSRDDGVEGRNVIAVAGIATPTSFFDTARAAGLEVLATIAFADHHRYRDRDVASLDAALGRLGADFVVTSTKDEVGLLDTEGGRALAGRGALAVLELDCRPLDPLTPLVRKLEGLGL